MHFSVIIATYNRPQALRRCLGFLQRQSWPADDFEVIVVDDGSKPPARALAAQFPEVRFVEQCNQGPGAARNTGAAHARGRFLAFTDDDCEPHEDWLREFAGAFEQEPHALLGGTTSPAPQAGFVDAVAQRIADMVYEHYNVRTRDARFFSSNNMAVERKAFLALQGFNGKVFARAGAEDRDFCDRWRFSSGSLWWVQSAHIGHWPQLTLWSFCRMYFRYGRGAARYHDLRAARGSGTLLEETSFHMNLPRLLLRRVGEAPRLPLVPTVGMCLLWQVCNAAGYAWEKLRP